MKKRILIVDDDPAIRKFFSRLLERHDFETRTAGDGPASLDIIGSESFDLILLDLKMPHMDGVQTLKEIRKMDANVPVYILTAFQDDYARELSVLQKDGILYEVLTKPIQADQFLTVVKNILGEAPGRSLGYKICLYKIGEKPELEKDFYDFKSYLSEKTDLNLEFEIIDCLENPDLALGAQILATPTIVKASPLPAARVVGSTADHRKTAAYLGIPVSV